jgi:hypothetical protein
MDMASGSMGGDMGASGDTGAPDLAATIEQLKSTIAGLSAQVEQVAEAAGLPPSGTEGSLAEEGAETPGQESAEGASPEEPAPDGSAGPAAPYKKKPAGNVMSFLNGKK